MGRGKPATEAVSFPRAEQLQASENSGQPFCGICGEDIDVKEEYLAVKCNICGTSHCHRECGVVFLQARAKEMCNSNAASKYQVRARKRPHEIFSMGMACPNGSSNDDAPKSIANQAKQPGGRDFHSKLTRVACSGFTQGAEFVKPVKEPPAPVPQVQPARRPKKQRATGPAAKPPAARKATSTPALSSSTASASAQLATSGNSRGANIVPAPGAGAAARLLGARRAQWTVTGASTAKKKGGGGGGASNQTTHHHPELPLCPSWLDCSECLNYNCELCHNEEKQRQHEMELAARQEGKAREAWHRELEEALAQMESLEWHRRQHLANATPHAPWALPAPTPATQQAPALSLSAHVLHLLRSFKHSCCLNTLLEMGFTAGQAQAATDATGADAEAAAHLLMDEQPCTGEKEADVSWELRELAAAAALHGIAVEAVEAQLAMMGGNAKAVCEALHQGGSMLSEEQHTLAPSEPDTPSLGVVSLPAWAADSSSIVSAPSPATQSPRVAAAPAASATATVDTPPGVLSLADFSSSPHLEGMFGQLLAAHETGAGATPAATATSCPKGLFVLDQATGMAAALSGATAFDAHHTERQPGATWLTPVSLSPAPGTDTFNAGFEAGLAAAQAALQQPAQYVQPDAGGYGDVGAYTWTPPKMDRQQPAEEEIDDLVHMLGIA